LESGLFTVVLITLFILISVFLLVFSWWHLHNPECHGFYRFFAFEGTVTIVLLNLPFWFRSPFSPIQLVSWTLLFFSILFLVQGFSSLPKLGGTRRKIEGSENFAFENTSTLVTEGIYK
jgi:multidrug transporter EmrE-like cation transporter